MLVYYCPKCQRQNPQPQCVSCGRALGNPSVRYVWEDSRLAVADSHRIGFLFRVSLVVSMAVVLVMLVIEYIARGLDAFSYFFLSTGIPAAALALGLIALALFGFAMMLEFRLDFPAGSSHLRGIGLGLAICDSIIKYHNGLISMESTVGAGTTFFIYLAAMPNGSARLTAG